MHVKLRRASLQLRQLFSERTVVGDVCASVCEHVLASVCAEDRLHFIFLTSLFLLGCLPVELNSEQSGVVNKK